MIEKKPFGRTGHLSSRVIFGAFAVSNTSPDQSQRVLEELLNYGINHIDTAPSYGDSEQNVGPWMAEHRQDFFLATKTLERTREGAWRELNQSLERLRVDTIDLWQMHYLVDPQEWEVAFGKGGALEAFIEARDQGIVRFLGVTGHDVAIPRMHLRSLERFDFDSVLLPFNYPMMTNPKYAADFEELVQLCLDRTVAIQTIKSLTKAPWGERPQVGNTWYEPLTEQAHIDRAVDWVLRRSELFLVSSGEASLLSKILKAAVRDDNEFDEDEMARLAAEISMRPMFE